MEYDKVQAKSNSMLSALEVLEQLKAQAPAAWDCAEVVGRWVWVSFTSKPSIEVRRVLLGLGFHWNYKRQTWQHCGGRRSTKSGGDPRAKYGAVPVSEIEDRVSVPA